MTPEEFERRVLYRDGNILVFDKPAGLAVHGGPSTPVHLETMLAALAPKGSRPLRPAHRLDRDTSGCLILARHDKAASRLGRLFSQGKVGKLYWAVVEGAITGTEGEVALALRKVNARSGWRVVADADGQTAVTRWQLMGQGQGLAWLELRPASGRTHQIRVHCASGLAAPVLGDAVYGRAGPPLHLMSRRIAIPYWADRPPIVVTAPVPGHMRAALVALGWTAESPDGS